MEYIILVGQWQYMSKTIYTKEHKYLVESLRKARIEAGLSQVDVAKLLRKGQSYVSKIEAGQRRVDVVQISAFAKIYNKPLGFFIKT